MKLPFFRQAEEMDCGATCLRIIAKYFGKDISLNELRHLTQTTKEGTNISGISEAAEKIGFRTIGLKVTFADIFEEKPTPFIAYWNQKHFIVVYELKKKEIVVADPAHGILTYTHTEFIKNWSNNDPNNEGIVLLLEATPKFYEEQNVNPDKRNTSGLLFLFKYLFRYKKLITQLIIGLLAGSLLQLLFPFLTQSIVDIGIQNQDVNFIYLVLIAQLVLFFSRTSMEVIRSWILLHISSRVNISLVSDFFLKLMNLPISYFDVKMTGDIMQRINDHYRIESFLTSTSLNTLFSLFNFLVFSIVLCYYNLNIFLVFLIGSILYFIWVLIFQKQRRNLDFKRFHQNSQNQSKVMELITGMQEIKLHNAERHKRWQWENIQAKLFKINIKGLSLTQLQNSGSALINELKNIIVTFLSAKLVLDGQITLGMMLSISYIIGQLNTPVSELVSFIQHWQDAKLSLERLAEIHNKEDEEPSGKELTQEIELNSSFHLKQLSFKYEGIGNDYVLKDLDLKIPANKITAIVGTSGSGKTTLMKLLLKFYDPTQGDILLNNTNLKNISSKIWRDRCGVVMQEGYIFSDSIANNIAVGVDAIDKEKLKHAVEVANIKEFIEVLPLGFNTKIGMEGIGISTGQKQRILIARAVYKNPDYLFFDEATSALDTNNEKVIMNNLNEFLKNKTVVVIAHRLSTVKNADQIVVLEKGKIIEKGTHLELTAIRGAYYELVKNQLELGS
jgi:ATP-binding cassette subfamily B protein